MRNGDIATSLFLAATDLLASAQAQPIPDQDNQLAPQRTPAAIALTKFAEDILNRRSKSLLLQLGSTVRHRVNASLSLLATIAAMGTNVTSHLARSLDMTSDTFSKLAHPPK